MKQVLIVAALSASLAAAAQAESKPPKATAIAPAPVLVLTEPSFDAEEVVKGEVIVAEFTLRNAGNADLTVSVKPACGCTTEEFDPIVPPGQTGRVVLRVDTSRFGAGPLSKSAGLATNDPTQPRLKLEVKATVTTLVDVLPNDSVTFRQYSGEKKAQTLTIRSKTEELLGIRDVEVANESIRHRLTQVPATTPGSGSEWSLELWLDEETKPGNLRGSVKLLTSSARVPIIPITVRGNVLGQVSVSPSTVHLRVDSEEPAQQAVTISHRNAGEFKLMSSELRSTRIGDEVAIETEVIRAGASYRVTVNYAGGLEPGNYTGKVVLGTSDADESVIEVPLYIVVT